MSEDYDAPTMVIRGIVLRAASGQQDSALGELLALTGSEDPHIAWMAAAAALPGMYWEGAIAEASVMVQRIVERFGAVATQEGLSGSVHFETAVAAGALYEQEEGVSRMLEMAGQLPDPHPLRDKLLWAAGHMVTHGPAALMPGCMEAPEEMRDHEAGLLKRGLDALEPMQIRRLWRHATHCGRRDVLLLLRDAHQPVPDVPMVMWALAQSLLEVGRPAEGEQVMLDARPVWYPLAVWDTLPCTPVLNPGLRPLVTERVTTAYLTLPVGEGVAR